MRVFIKELDILKINLNRLEKLQEYDKEYKKINKDKIKQQIIKRTLCYKCKLYISNYKNNYLCSYCNPIKSIRKRTKENNINKFLLKNFISNKKCNIDIDNTCQTHYPDFLIDCNTFFLIIRGTRNAERAMKINWYGIVGNVKDGT